MEEAVTTNGRASLQTIDARVGRLEEAQGRTDQAIAVMQAEQVHTRELMTAQFATVNTALNSQSNKLDNFITRMEGMILEATRNSGDLIASPVGRQVNDRLVRVEQMTDRHDSFVDRVTGMSMAIKVLFGTSLLAVVASLASIYMTLQPR